MAGSADARSERSDHWSRGTERPLPSHTWKGPLPNAIHYFPGALPPPSPTRRQVPLARLRPTTSGNRAHPSRYGMSEAGSGRRATSGHRDNELAGVGRLAAVMESTVGADLAAVRDRRSASAAELRGADSLPSGAGSVGAGFPDGDSSVKRRVRSDTSEVQLVRCVHGRQLPRHRDPHRGPSVATRTRSGPNG
jgi:hypothetical protein